MPERSWWSAIPRVPFTSRACLPIRNSRSSDSDIAGAVLISGIYRSSADAGATEKSYFGSDASKYEERSAFPGILKTETPLLVAWSALDPPRLVAEGEKLKDMLCHSPAHCPHTTVLRNRDAVPVRPLRPAEVWPSRRWN